MKVVVDFDTCTSNAVCMGILPSVFEVRDDGFLYVLNEHPGEELREKVLHVVNALPKIYQQIILLRHLRKMTYREMGDFLGLPVATIESRLYRARLMLKDKLMDLYW